MPDVILIPSREELGLDQKTVLSQPQIIEIEETHENVLASDDAVSIPRDLRIEISRGPSDPSKNRQYVDLIESGKPLSVLKSISQSVRPLTWGDYDLLLSQKGDDENGPLLIKREDGSNFAPFIDRAGRLKILRITSNRHLKKWYVCEWPRSLWTEDLVVGSRFFCGI